MLQEETDKLITGWMTGLAASTKVAYEREITRFLNFVDRPLVEINREHLGAYMDDLTAMKLRLSSISRAVYVIRSFWAFLFDEGHITRSPFRRIRPQKSRDDLAQKILSEEEIGKLLAAYPSAEKHCQEFGTRDGEDEILDCLLKLECDGLSMKGIAEKLNALRYRTRAGHSWNASGICGVLNSYHTHRGWSHTKRNELLLKVLYFCGSRVSETCDLRWRDVQPRSATGQICFYGKGSKTRSILLPRKLYGELTEFRNYVLAGDDDPLFPSHRGGAPIGKHCAWGIVRKAAEMVDLAKKISPHTLRHSHASHALDRNCPLHVLRDCLGHSSLHTTSRYCHARPTEASSLYLLPDDPSPEPTTETNGEPSFKYHPAIAV